MKILKIISIILVVVIFIFSVAIFIALRSFDINQYKSQITERLSDTLGREVRLGHVALKTSAGQGIVLTIKDLAIADHPNFSAEPFFTVGSVTLGVDVMAFITKREMLVSNILLKSPECRLIRNQEGVMNIQTLLNTTQPQPAQAAEISSSAATQTQDAGPAGQSHELPPLLVKSVYIEKGKISFTDRMVSPELVLPVTDIHLQTSNVSLDKPFQFDVTCSLFSDRRNIEADGTVLLDVQNTAVKVSDGAFETDLSHLDVKRLRAQVPPLAEIGLENNLQGLVRLIVDQMVAGENGLAALSLNGQLLNGKVKLRDLLYPIENIDVRFEMTESDLKLDELFMYLASGKINARGRIDNYLRQRGFSFTLNLEDVLLDELVSQEAFPVNVKGKLYGTMEGKGEALNKAALQNTLAGGGTFEIKEGRLEDINVLKLVLSKISFLPNLVEDIEANLPERYKEKLKQKDTILNKVQLDTRLDKNALLVDKAELDADGFLLLASGSLDLDQNLTLRADFFVPQDLSASMVASVEELSYLLDDQRQVKIPFRPYSGKLASFRIYPDLEDLGKKVIRERGKEELKNVLFKALDLEEESPPPDQNGQEEGAPPQEEKPPRPEEILIENIFDAIFE